MPSSGSCWYKLTAKWNYGFQHRVDLGRHQDQSSGLSSAKRKTSKESRTGWQVIKHCCCPWVRLCGTAGSQPGGMHTLGSLKTLHKPPLMTAPDTAVRQAYTLTQVSTPLFIRRNAFHNHSCEVHSCLILLALLTYKKTDYGWWNFLMHNKESWKYVTKYQGGVAIQLWTVQQETTGDNCMLAIFSWAAWISNPWGTRKATKQAYQPNQGFRELIWGKNQELSVYCTPAVHFSADLLHQVLNHCMK